VASGLSEAVSALSLNGPESRSNTDDEKHPEKRMKAAYKEYEEKNFPILKKENPSLKYSQLKDLLWKQWQKSNENPMVQAAQAAARERIINSKANEAMGKEDQTSDEEGGNG